MIHIGGKKFIHIVDDDVYQAKIDAGENPEDAKRLATINIRVCRLSHENGAIWDQANKDMQQVGVEKHLKDGAKMIQALRTNILLRVHADDKKKMEEILDAPGRTDVTQFNDILLEIMAQFPGESEEVKKLSSQESGKPSDSASTESASNGSASLPENASTTTAA